MTIAMPEVTLHADRKRKGEPGYDPREFAESFASFRGLLRTAKLTDTDSGCDNDGPYLRQLWSGDPVNGTVTTEVRKAPLGLRVRILHTIAGLTADFTALLPATLPEPEDLEVDILVDQVQPGLRALQVFRGWVLESVAVMAPPFA